MINSATNKTNNTNKKITTKNTKKILNIKFMSFIIISTIIICLTSCNRKSSLESTITVVDSLGWQDNLEFAFSGSSSLMTNENELFVFGGNSFWVYDINTLQHLRSFGSKGKGPGEILSSWSYTFDSEDNIVVSDKGNMRLQWFDRTGNFIKSIPTQLPWNIYNYDNNIYLTNCYILQDFAYKMVNNGSLETILNLQDICENTNISTDDRDLKIIQKNGTIIVAFYHYKPHLFIYDNSLKKGFLIKIETPLENKKNISESFLSNVLTEENSFFVIFCLLEKMIDVIEAVDNSYDVKKRSGMQEYLCEYSYKGNLINRWKIPNYIYSSSNSLAKFNDVIFIQDFFSGIIYKFKLN